MTKLNLALKIRRSSWVTRILIALGVILALCLLVILVEAGVSHNKIHAGVSIAGHDMGGLTRDQAIAKLTKLANDAQSNQILLTSPKKSWPIMPDDTGTVIDAAGTVAAAMNVSRSGNFITNIGHRFSLYSHHVDVPFKGTVDTQKLDSLIASVAKVLDVPAVNAGLTIANGKITVVEDKPGTVVDREKLREQLKALLFTLHATELPVPMKVDKPAVVAALNDPECGRFLWRPPFPYTDADFEEFYATRATAWTARLSPGFDEQTPREAERSLRGAGFSRQYLLAFG